MVVERTALVRALGGPAYRPILGLLALGCSDGSAECSVRTARETLVNGVESTGFLGLSPVQRQALGWLALEGQALPNGNICTVTRVAPRWALTAAHCFHPAPDSIVAVFETGETVVDLRDVVIHPNRDLALLPLGVTGPHLPWVEHLPLQVHDRVEVGGYGVDEAGRTGHLAFGVAVVASLAEHD